MCGIVGYIGRKSIVPLLLNSLQSLEYRGYDSAGIAYVDLQGEMHLYKKAGKLSNLRTLVSNQATHQGSNDLVRGMGHTRWATHGSPTDENAHPHQSNDGQIAIVHNGIIENYSELKDELQAKGYKFKSKTDTECVVHLLEDLLKTESNFHKALQQLAQRLTGAYALVILDKRQPDLLFGIRHQAPMVIGVGQQEMFLASDPVAIAEHTSEVAFIKDGQIVEISPAGYAITNFQGEPIDTHVETIAASQLILDKKGFRHFMLKEIYEQPDVVRRLLSEYMHGDEAPIDLVDPALIKKLAHTKRLVIIGCGTSLNAGMVGKYFIEAAARIDVNVESAGEYRYRNPLVDQDTMVVAISQSGETADTLAALRQCRQKGATIITVTNREDSTMARESDLVFPVHAGIEVSVCATKSFVAQLIVLYLLGLQLAEARQTIDNFLLTDLKHGLQHIPIQIEAILANTEPMHQVAKKYSNAQHMIFMARGMNYAVALEGALKLKEVSYIHAEGYSASELKHGPIAMLDHSIPITAILTPSELYEKMISNCQEAKARDAQVIAIHAGPVPPESTESFDDVIQVPVTHEWLSPLLTVIPLQFLAYYIAESLGKDVDQPRNLAKSVTVE